MLQEPVLDANGGVCEWQCYLDRYVDLGNAFGATNTAAAANHWTEHGKGEERDCTCVPEVPATLSDIMNPTEVPKVTEPQTEPSKEKAQSKCVLGKADCGLLNDNMALMWGDIKDAKDELKSIMADNEAHCKSVRNMHNTEISTYKAAGDQKNVELSEATGS